MRKISKLASPLFSTRLSLIFRFLATADSISFFEYNWRFLYCQTVILPAADGLRDKSAKNTPAPDEEKTGGIWRKNTVKK